MIPLQIILVIAVVSLSVPVTPMTADPSFYNQPLGSARDLSYQQRRNNFLGMPMHGQDDTSSFMRRPYQSMDMDRNGRQLRYRNSDTIRNRDQSYYPNDRRNQYDNDGRDNYYKVQTDRDYSPYDSDAQTRRYPGGRTRGYATNSDMPGLRRQLGSRMGYQDEHPILMNLR